MKVEQHWGWADKKALLIKKRVYSTIMYVFYNVTFEISENLHFVVAWMSRNSVLEIGTISDIKWLKQSSNHIVCKQTLSHLAKLVEFLFTH